MNKLEIIFTTQFKKDYKLSVKQGKNVKKLFDIVELLANNQPLPEKYHDHALSGKFTNCRECHIEPDWLLIYQIKNEILSLVLTRVGSHSDLFKK